MTKGSSPSLSAHLTIPKASYRVLGAGGRLSGAVIRARDNRFVAWTRKRLHVYPTMRDAESRCASPIASRR